MEEFRCNKKNNKWYKKIDWKRAIIYYIILFIICFLVFYWLGKDKYISNAIFTSIIISFLIILEFVLNDLIENRKKIFYTEKNNIFYIELHDQKDGKFISDTDFDEIIKNKKAKEVYNNISDYEGIDCGKIEKVLSVKKKSNKIVVVALVKSKEWVPMGRITIKKLSLENKNKEKKIVIQNDFDNYDKLYKLFEEKIIKKNK